MPGGPLRVAVREHGLAIGPRLRVSFHRTRRVAEGERPAPLPEGLGPFPVSPVAGDASEPPRFALPVREREAMWIAFEAAAWKPNAVKVGVGRINALTGAPWDDTLHADPQDYLICPDQLWLDGVHAGAGFVRQFVAMPLGEGYTVEGQLGGGEEEGGLRLLVFEPAPGRFPDEPPPPAPRGEPAALADAGPPGSPLGMGAGARIAQKIYPDRFGVEAWDPESRTEVVVLLVPPAQFRALVGHDAPEPDAAREAGEPHWFALDDDDQRDVPPTERMSDVRPVAEVERERGDGPSSGEAAPDAQRVRRIRPDRGEP